MTNKTPLPNKASDLLTTLRVGPYTLKNRVFMAPLTRCRAGDDHTPGALMQTYYAQRSSAGLIISEATFVSPQGTGYPNAPGIYNEKQIRAWQNITRAVHAQGGKIFLQLWHVGRVSHPSYYGGELPVAPSAIATSDGMAATYTGRQPFVVPRALATAEIPDIVRQFQEAARNAESAGFDGVEIHAANGFLLDQFLRDGANKRTDLYGGSVKNRARLLMEVVEAVSQVWGSERVGVRLSPTGTYNSMSDSNPGATFRYVARQLSLYELAYLHVIEAWGGDLRHGAQILPPEVLRKAYDGVLVVNGGYDKASGNASIANALADAVAYGHLFIANPDLPRRFELDAPLNVPDKQTFYTAGAGGYTDYPSLN